MVRSSCALLFSKIGAEVFWLSSFYWAVPIILMVLFSRFEYDEAIAQRITNPKLKEIESLLIEQGSATHSDGGLYIDGKTTSQIGHGVRVKLKLISAPSSLYESANKMDKKAVVLFDRVLSQSRYSTKMIREE
ncbi:hypothetical protein [Acinetobacter baumannii]|uniref:hypothetical protein n=1 Tax=Acinetobacter baumannii TaxID=470 RepID=UPI002449B8EE|nr:hypothetical protein [Acinetobacter baumannii]MDH2522812.1 hypothetical protein [Acinetobacter baumannii]